jgi:hypothetical protein
MKKKSKNTSVMKLSETQCKDAGMAFVLLFLILNFSFPGGYWLFIATAILVITMCVPGIIKPFAKVWYYGTEFMGTYVSKLILFVVFYIVVTPIGLLRRLLKKDTLKLQEYKKGQKSVMDERNKIYKPGDIVKPF